MSQAFAILAICSNYIFQLYPIYVPSVLSIPSVFYQYPINVLIIFHNNTAYSKLTSDELLLEKLSRVSSNPGFSKVNTMQIIEDIQDLFDMC